MTAYARLQSRFARIGTVNEAQAMLDWDAAAMMPPGGAPARADQLAVLAGVAHGLLIAPETQDDLAAAEAVHPQGEWDTANLRLMRHAHTRATALPSRLVEDRTRINSQCEKVWRKARADNDFAMVAPYLVEVVVKAREAADALGAALGLDPYDALMNGYQQGIGVADVNPIFDRYQAFLSCSLPEAEALQAEREAPLPLAGLFSAERQEGLCRHLAARAGLNFQHARLDRSAHPFCGGSPTDIRITTRYDESDPTVAIMGVLHETGHALYESGLPSALARQPVSESAGMAVHESQSLIIEMQACRTEAYLTWLGPELHGTFGGDPAVYTATNLIRLWQRVERSLIRVDADEMTYPAHVILRFRLEQALIDGSLQVGDLPGAWHDGMNNLLGVVPPDDARGCLQDIHWYFGAFGYFPSYSLGAMAAAQMMHTALREVPELGGALGRGELQPLVEWLRSRIHNTGNRLGLNDLLRFATGSALDPSYFETHLKRRYLQPAKPVEEKRQA